MAEEKIIEAFIKAVDKNFFDTFINEGEICMNTLQWFRDYEFENPEIGDKYEGAIFAAENDVTISSAPIGQPELFEVLSKKAKDVCIYNSRENGNILSLYTICGDTDIHYIPNKFIDEFNNHRFCLITAPGLFLDKLYSEIKKKYYTANTLMVKYHTPNGAWSPYYKRVKYAYQNETRVFFKDTVAIPQIFKIGSIKDFAIEIFPQKLIYKICMNEEQKLIVAAEE